MNLTKLAIKRPAMMSMVIMVFVVLGLYTYNKMGVELTPSVNMPYVAVVTTYPGAGAEEIETQITKPLEDELSSLSRLKRITSQASEGFTFTLLEFEMTADADQAALDVQKKIDMLKERLPDDASDPVVYKRDMNDQPVLVLALQSHRPLYETKEIAEDVLKDRLQRLGGVAEVSVVGGQEREITVSIDKTKLAGYGLSLNQVINRLRAENMNQPSGRLDQPEAEYNVRVMGEFGSLEEIENLDIPLGNGDTVPLGAVAEVTDGHKEVREYSRVNGVNAVAVMIYKQSDASIVEVGERVKEEIEKINKELPDDIKIIVSRDTSQFIRASLNNTRNSIIEGIFTTALALYLFLREWRSTIIVALAIPTSLLAALMMMFFSGFTFNMMSLMGLALCIGILVDDSIVVLENIHRHLKMGKDPAKAALDGRMEIGMAAVAITLSDIVVFTPIAFMQGLVGQFFRQFGLTVVYAALFSLFVSFTLTPMMAAKLFKSGNDNGTEAGLKGRKSIFSWLWKRTEPIGLRMKDKYVDALNWSLNHRKTIIVTVIVTFLSSLMLPALNIIGAEQMPKVDQGELTVNLEMPVGTPIEKTDEALRQVEEYLKTIPEIKYYHTTLGSTGGMQGSSAGSHLGRIGLQLYDKKERERSIWDVGEQIRQWGKGFIQGRITVTEADNMGPPGGDIQIEITGSDTKKLVAVSEQVKSVISTIPGAKDVDTDWLLGQPEVQIKIDRRKAASMGLSVEEIARTVRAGLNGDVASKFRKDSDEIDIVVRLAGLNKSDIDSIKNLPLTTAAGNLVLLQQVADVEKGSGPTEIKRINRQRAITVNGNLRGRSLNEFLVEAREKLSKIEKELEPGYHITFAGQAEGMKETFTDLISALVLSIVLVYMVLVMLYESFLTPFIRMLALPLGIVGAFLALALTGNTLNLFSMIGLIMMDGLVAKNGTLLIDYTHTLMDKGFSLREALVEAGKTRMRPIIMTTVTMVFGMLPTALAMGEGAETRSGMAWVLIGGLISSTIFTLIIIPVVYTVIDDMKKSLKTRIRRFRSAKQV